MLADIERYRELGYVFDDGETEGYIRYLAAPVYNFENKAVGVISATKLIFQENQLAETKAYIEKFMKIAEAISYKQGYRP